MPKNRVIVLAVLYAVIGAAGLLTAIVEPEPRAQRWDLLALGAGVLFICSVTDIAEALRAAGGGCWDPAAVSAGELCHRPNLIFGERHLRSVLARYAAHCNRQRQAWSPSPMNAGMNILGIGNIESVVYCFTTLSTPRQDVIVVAEQIGTKTGRKQSPPLRRPSP